MRRTSTLNCVVQLMYARFLRCDRVLNQTVQPRELEIDSRTGMKNYIANGAYPNRTMRSSLTLNLDFRKWFLGHFKSSCAKDTSTMH